MRSSPSCIACQAFLIVFNHPVWDLYKVGGEWHLFCVNEFLSSSGQFIRTLELNGLRSSGGSSWRFHNHGTQAGERKELPAVKFGSQWRIRRKDVLAISLRKNVHALALEVARRLGIFSVARCLW